MDKNRSPIFVIVTIENVTERKPTGNPRPVGFYHTYEEAFEAATNNYCDIYECGSYPYLVIERNYPGLYPDTYNNEFWFKWDDSQNKYVECERPDEFKQMCNFGIG